VPTLDTSASTPPILEVDEKQCGLPSRHGRSAPSVLGPRSVGWGPGVFLTPLSRNAGSAFGNAIAGSAVNGMVNSGAMAAVNARLVEMELDGSRIRQLKACGHPTSEILTHPPLYAAWCTAAWCAAQDRDVSGRCRSRRGAAWQSKGESHWHRASRLSETRSPMDGAEGGKRAL
jgi:hypothetical protein